MQFSDCTFDSALAFEGAKVRSLVIDHCRLPGFAGESLKVEHSIHITNTATSYIDLSGAAVGGDLYLHGSVVEAPTRFRESNNPELDPSFAESILGCVALHDAQVEGVVWASGGRAEQFLAVKARFGGLDFDGTLIGSHSSSAPAAVLDRAVIRGDLSAANGFRSWGEFRMLGASIEGVASFIGAVIENSAGYSLSADRTVFGQMLDLEESRLRGELRLPGCRVEGNLVLRKSTLESPSGTAIRATRLRVLDDLQSEAVRVIGAIDLAGSQIDGTAYFTAARIDHGGGVAIKADHLTCGGDLVFAGNTSILGGVVLDQATVSGALRLARASISQPNGVAFSANGARLDGGAWFGNLSCDGGVSLISASVDKVCTFTGASITVQSGPAVALDHAVINCGVRFDALFANGALRVAGASIRGQTSLRDARVPAAGPYAISFDGTTISGDLLCQGMAVSGTVRIPFARIDGMLDISGAVMHSADVAFLAERTHVAKNVLLRQTSTRGDVLLIGCETPGAIDLRLRRHSAESIIDLGSTACEELDIRGLGAIRSLNLTASRVRGLFDSGTEPMAIGLRGADINRFVGTSVDAKQRRSWIRRSVDNDGFSPEPYDAVAAAFRRTGHSSEARTVSLFRERDRRRFLPWWHRVVPVLFDATVGYGYRLRYTLGWLAVLVTIGAYVFGQAFDKDQFIAARATVQPFSGLIYTMDRMIPVVSFGMRDSYAPTAGTRYWAVAYAIVGWVLTTAVVAGLTNLIRRD
ncbi:hypothetical protein [Patulibacter americanus]|uniref:hypothetical protein n=1 Tax=Patulibacter americanus TaxID=588672 RepID=UPI0003B7B273|nr:hypothetical protein [Patulibacter americanus]